MKTENPEEYKAKTEDPADWIPGRASFPDDPGAWGENYPAVNTRLERVVEKINHALEEGHPAILSTSGEVALASMHETGFGSLGSLEFRNGQITAPNGLIVPTTTFENGGIVSYHDPEGTGSYTHMQIVQPNWSADDPYTGPGSVNTGLISIGQSDN